MRLSPYSDFANSIRPFTGHCRPGAGEHGIPCALVSRNYALKRLSHPWPVQTGFGRGACWSPKSVGAGLLAAGDLARLRVERDPLRPAAVREVEHAVERSGQLVHRVVADPPEAPVVLDEAKDRGLVGQGMVDEVRPRVRGDAEQREPGPVTAAARVAARRRLVAAPALAVQRVEPVLLL